MSIDFKRTAYLSVHKTNQNIKDAETLFKNAKENPQYKYGKVNFKEFSEQYVSDGCVQRKFVALPKMLWCGAVKTIYDLTKGIFIGSFKAFSDRGSYLKAQIFHAGRDLQESFGWLITLFHDKYGSYHIQESQFHKSCYDSFKKGSTLSHPNLREINSVITSTHKMTNEADKIKKLNHLFPEDIQKAFEADNEISGPIFKLLLDKQKKELKLSRFDRANIHRIFSKESDEVRKKQLGFFTADDIQTAIQKKLLLPDMFPLVSDKQLKGFKLASSDKRSIDNLFALKSKEEIRSLLDTFSKEDVQSAIQKGLLDDIVQFASAEQLQGLKLTTLPKKTVEDLFLVSYEGIEGIKWRLDCCSFEEIQAAIKQDLLPEVVLSCVRNESLEGLTLSSLPKKTITEFLPYFRDDKALERRLSFFSVDDIQAAIKKDLLTKTALKCVPDVALEGLTLSSLSKETIDSLLLSEDPERRLSFFSTDDIQTAIQKNLLDDTSLRHLSIEHLKNLKISLLPREKINHLFPTDSYYLINLNRFSHLISEEVHTAIAKDLLDPSHLRLVSGKQLEGLKVSSLSKLAIQSMFPSGQADSAERFSHVSPLEVQSALEKGLLDNRQRFISDTQISALKISSLPKQTICDLFSCSITIDKNAERLNHVSTADLHAAIKKDLLDPDLLKLIAIEKFKGLRLSSLNGSTVIKLFLLPNDEKRKKLLNIFSPDDILAAIKNGLIDGDLLKLIPIEKLKGLRLSSLSDTIIAKLFAFMKYEEGKKYFSIFPPDDVQAAIQQGLLFSKVLKLISNQQLKEIKLSSLRGFQIDDLFPSTLNVEENKKRFSVFSPDDVQAAIQNNLLLDKRILGFISDNQLRGIKLSALTRLQIWALFPSFYNLPKDINYQYLEDRRRFAFISIDEVHKALKAGLLKEKTHFLSSEQRKGVDPSLLDENYGFKSSSYTPPQATVLKKQNNYEILGVSRFASRGEIKKAFYGLSRKFHPDKCPPKEPNETDEAFEKRKLEHEDKFKGISNAYHELIP